MVKQKSIRDYLVELCWEVYKDDTDEEDFFENLDDYMFEFIFYQEGNLKIVWEGDHDQRRWGTSYAIVAELPDGRCIKYWDFLCDERQDRRDYVNFDLDDITEVFPVQVMTTVYKTKNEIEKDG